MDLNELAKTLHVTYVAKCILAFGACLAPGLLLIKLFWPQLLIDLDAVKLIFLSLSISIPFIVAHIFCIGGLENFHGPTDHNKFYPLVAMTNVMVTTSLLIMAYLLGLSFKRFVMLALSAEVFLVIGCVIIGAVKKPN